MFEDLGLKEAPRRGMVVRLLYSTHLCDWHLVVCSNLRAEVLHFVNNALIIIVCMMPFLTLCAFFGFLMRFRTIFFLLFVIQ